MNSYLDLINIYGQVHKKKHRITILCISIAVCLVTAIFGMADMEMEAQRIRIYNENGNWHVNFDGISEDTSQLISARSDVAKSSWIGILDKEGYTLNGKSVNICGSNEEMAYQMGLKLIDGTYPVNPTDATIDKTGSDLFRISIGDQVSINTENGAIIQVTITGIMDDFSSLLKNGTHGIQMTTEGVRSNISEDSVTERYYVQFNKGVNIRKSINSIESGFSIPDEQINENVALLGTLGQSEDSYLKLMYSTAAVFFVIVLLASVLMIASSFHINVMDRIRFFGLLRCLGASKAQIKRFVLLESLRYSFKGIPIGLLMGTAIMWLLCAFLKFVNPKYFNEMPLFGLSNISLITGVLVGLLTVMLASMYPCKKASKVSPLCAINGNLTNNLKHKPKLSAKTKYSKVEYALGFQHAVSNKKNLGLMIESFAISIVLFLCFSVLVDFMYQAIRPIKPWTPDISIVSSDNTCSIDNKLLMELKEESQIKRAYGRMFAYDLPVQAGESNGVIHLLSYDSHQFKWGKSQLIEGSIEAVESEENQVLVEFSNDLTWKVGDKIQISVPSGKEEVTIAGILADTPFSNESGKQMVICSENTFRTLTGEQGFTIIDIQLNPKTSSEFIAKLRGMASETDQFLDNRKSKQESTAVFYSFAIFIYGFLVIIALITVFNIINSMNMSISGRIKQFGAMRAVGMSVKQLHKMVATEAAMYAICGCIAGGVIGLPLHYLCFQTLIASKWGLTWEMPIIALVIIILLSLFATMLSILAPIKRIGQMDIVDTLSV